MGVPYPLVYVVASSKHFSTYKLPSAWAQTLAIYSRRLRVRIMRLECNTCEPVCI